ncbi:MAG: hypothetical protein KIT72_18815 [Polyangiaceae bacterium]|nr:hypothetical protein [Polyangiaceae bacterium]MCW5792472.1 hypothetical protein [Polyangiaceae bacterium]
MERGKLAAHDEKEERGSCGWASNAPPGPAFDSGVEPRIDRGDLILMLEDAEVITSTPELKVSFLQRESLELHELGTSGSVIEREVRIQLDSFLEREGDIATLSVYLGVGNLATWSDTFQVAYRRSGWEILPYDPSATVRVSALTEGTSGEFPWDPDTRALDFSGRTHEDLIEAAKAGITLQPSEPRSEMQSPRALTTLCFKQHVQQVGAGVGEDLFDSDSAHHRSAGMWIVVGSAFSGILDANGCTPPLNMSAGFKTISALPLYQVNGRTVLTRSWGASSSPWLSFNILFYPSGGTVEYTFSPAPYYPHFNTGLFAISGLRRWPGNDAYLYMFWVESDHNRYRSWDTGDLEIRDYDNKTMVNHELGHAFFDRNTSADFMSNDFIIADPPPCDKGGNKGHDIDSTEHAQATFSEAAATYYAAVSWNFRDLNGDCWLYHHDYTGGVNCDGGQTLLPLAFMENKCSVWSGRGVEIDWLRALWNIRTSGAMPADDAILSWIDAAPSAYTLSNTYSNLDAAANLVGGSINTNWDSTKITNGLNP